MSAATVREHRGRLMISRDPRCVFVANQQHEAALVIALLGEEGIEADVVNSATLGGLEGVVGIIPRAGIKGMEVWVQDASKAEAARELLARQTADVQAIRAARQSRTGNVDVPCSACGRVNTFPAAQQGTVQSCTRCGAYLDIPDPNDTSEWPEDFGSPEDESEGQT